jgi:glycerophosphoryl diester phosphodiesterase
VKDVSAAKTLVADALSVGFPLQNLWLCHFDLSQVLAMRKIHSDVRIVDSTRLNKMKDGPEMRSALLAENGIDALNMHISDWSGGLVTLVHRFNVLAFGWDAQFAPVLTSAFRMGLDGVYSDYVDRMVDVYTSEIGCVPPT